MQARNQHRHQDAQQRRLEARMQIGEDFRQRTVHRHAVENPRHAGHQGVDGRRTGKQKADAQPHRADITHDLFGEAWNRHGGVQQMHPAGGIEQHVFHLALHRGTVDEHAGGDAEQAQHHGPGHGPGGLAQVRCQRRDEFAADKHEHGHAHQRQHRDHIGAHHGRAKPALQLHRRCGDQAQHAEHHQGGPHAKRQDDFGPAKGTDTERIEYTKHHYEPHAQQPGAACRFGQGVEVFEVHQGHDPGQDCLGGAGEHMDNQIGRQRPGNGEETAHATVDVVIDRAGGREN